MGADQAENSFSVIEGGWNPCLLVICVAGLTTAEATACAALSEDIVIELVRESATPSLAKLCRRHGLTLADVIVIASRPQDLPFILEAHMAFALQGSGYENEAAADRVFPPRAAGGLVEAIRYVRALGAPGAPDTDR